MEAAIDDGLTVKQGKFAALVARGLNYSDAYAQVFKCKGMSQKTVNEKASRLAADGKVRARIRAILEEARVADVDDAAVAFNDLLRHLRKAEDAENWTAVASFDRLRLQHHGLLKNDLVITSGGPERDRQIIDSLAGDDPVKRKALKLIMGSDEVFVRPEDEGFDTPQLVVDNSEGA